jgi:hypothetical protein
MHLAGIGPLHRYEAYLLALGIYAVTLGLSGLWSRNRLLVAALVAGTALPLGHAGWVTLRNTPVSSVNTWEQQYQLERFLREHYTGRTVVANDVGCINWLADIRCLDNWGLATNEVFRAKTRGLLSSALLDSLSRDRDARIAVVYDNWFSRHGEVPSA